MNTLITSSPQEAARILLKDGLVAFPTETVYGLGSRIDDETAVERIFKAKGRPADNPLIVHISDKREIGSIAIEMNETASRLADAFFPGPLTLVLPKHPDISKVVTAGLDTIGVRMPDDECALQFLRLCGQPVAAPSANRSGRPSPTSWEAVRDDLDGRIDCILKGAATRLGLESTVVDVTGPRPLVLRPGSITIEDLRLVHPKTEFHSGNMGGAPRSPGIRHRHYRPAAEVVAVDGPSVQKSDNIMAYIGMEASNENIYAFTMVVKNAEHYARELFSFFRRCEKQGIDVIHCQRVPETGIGKALMDRLDRASA